MHGTLTPISGEHATRKLLDQLWQRNLPTLHSRLALFDAVAEAAAADTLTAELRTQAASEAHKLAGSLGMFGRHAGTDAAREIEVYLDRETPVEPGEFSRLAKTLRTTLPD